MGALGIVGETAAGIISEILRFDFIPNLLETGYVRVSVNRNHSGCK